MQDKQQLNELLFKACTPENKFINKEEHYKPIKSKSLLMEAFSFVEKQIVFLDSERIVSTQALNYNRETYVLKVWDVNTGKHINTLQDQSLHTCVGKLKDSWLVCGSPNRPLSMWNIDTGQCLDFLESDIAGIKAFKVLPNNQIVAWHCDDSLRIWDANTKECLNVLKVGAYNGTIFIDMLPNGQPVTAVFNSYNRGVIQAWDLTANTFKASEIQSIIMGGMIVLSNDLIVVSNNDDVYDDAHALQVWDINQQQCLKILTGHTANITCMKLLSHHQIISASYDKTLRIWDWKKGECLKILQCNKDVVVGIHVLSGGKFLTLSQDGSIKTWESFSTFSSAAELRKNTRTLHEFLAPNPENQAWRAMSFFSKLPQELVTKIISDTRDPEYHTEAEAQPIIASHSCKPT